MPMNQDNKNKNYIRWGVTAFLVILASMIAYYIIFNLDNFKGNSHAGYRRIDSCIFVDTTLECD